MNRLQRWEARSEKVLTTAALVFLGAYAAPFLWSGLARHDRLVQSVRAADGTST